MGKSKSGLPESGDECLSRDATDTGRFTGSNYPCRLAGCTGVRLGVKWSNKSVTWPCSKGLKKLEISKWQLG